MHTSTGLSRFLRTASGQGLVLFLVFAAGLSGAVGYGFYSSSVNSFRTQKTEEKATALRLVEAFVNDYSELRAKFGPDAPVPATFRAHSIEMFNKAAGTDGELRLQWVGRPHRSIVTAPTDAPMAATVESFVGMKSPAAKSQFLRVNGRLVFRTVYPSFAKERSCVDCHNKVQPDLHWKLGDLMGAFSIDVPAGPFLRDSALQAGGLGLALILALGAVGIVVARLHYRQISEREAAQGSLKESEERFRDFAESASDWFWEQDEHLRFTFVSSGSPDGAGGNVIGKTRAELVTVGRHLGISEDQWQAHDAAVRERRPFHGLRFQRLGADGIVHHISVSGRPIFDGDGRFRGYRGTGRDVTGEIAVELELARRVEERTAELRKAQSDLLRKERLSTLGQLTATVAHELRNPLSAIRNTVFALKETVASAGLNAERPLSRVERNIQRCDRIITDLLDFTRLRSLNRAEVEADAWLEEVLIEQRLPQNIVLRHVFGAPGHRVSLDAERMRRVVINLTENAAQAMAESATSGVASVVTVSTRTTADYYELAIEDTGPGIPDEVLAKVFEPLFSTKSFGTGLGLPTVKQIVEQHGGTVAITSVPGKGTRVVVRLPNRETEELAA
ncbi:MAG TPA: ATP-binding protein [Stellaceae bacterium]|nr:ATP-binding protein [Stellaceae bacterium]